MCVYIYMYTHVLCINQLTCRRSFRVRPSAADHVDVLAQAGDPEEAYTYVHVYIYICVYIYIYLYIYIYIYIYICIEREREIIRVSYTYI